MGSRRSLTAETLDLYWTRKDGVPRVPWDDGGTVSIPSREGWRGRKHGMTEALGHAQFSTMVVVLFSSQRI